MDEDKSIEVTSEMVDAGLAELFPCELRPYQDEEEVLGRVFRAMVNLWPDYQPTNDQCERPNMIAERPD